MQRGRKNCCSNDVRRPTPSRKATRFANSFPPSNRSSSTIIISSNADCTLDGTYKTELCNKYIENGHCPYGSRCQFAHGERELRRSKRSDDRRYKTQKCRNFWNHGTCRYGKRCQFIHDETEEELMGLRREPFPVKLKRTQGLKTPTISPCSSTYTSPVLGPQPATNLVNQHLLFSVAPALRRTDSFCAILSDVAAANEKKSGLDGSVSDSDSDSTCSAESAMVSPPRPRLNVFRRMCSDTVAPSAHGSSASGQYREPLSPFQRRVANSIAQIDGENGCMSPRCSACA